MARDITQRIVVKGKDNSQRAFRSVNQSLATMATKVGIALTAITSLAGGLGLGALIKKQQEFNDTLAKTADRIGATTKGLVALQHAGNLAGSSTEEVNKAMEKMVRSIGDLEAGLGFSTVKFLDRMNLTIEDLLSMNAEEQFHALATEINKFGTQAEKAAAAAAFFGRGGIKLMNLLEGVEQNFALAKEETELFGLAISRVDARAIEAANDDMHRMQQMLNGVGSQLAIQLAPAIQQAFEKLNDFVKEAGGIPKIVEDITKTAKEAFEDLKVAVAAFAIYVGGKFVIGNVVLLAKALVALRAKAVAATIAMRALKIASVIGIPLVVAELLLAEEGAKDLAEEIKKVEARLELATKRMKQSKEGTASYEHWETVVGNLKVELEGLNQQLQASVDDLGKLDELAGKTPAKITPKVEEVKDVISPTIRPDIDTAQMMDGADADAITRAIEEWERLRDIEVSGQATLAEVREAARVAELEEYAAQGVRRQEQREAELQADMEMQDEITRLAKIGEQQRAKLKEQGAKDTINTVKYLGQALGKQSKAGFKLTKAAGIAEAIINTHKGITKALELPFPFNLAAAAATAAKGFASVAAIRSQSFGGGSSNASGAGGTAVPSLVSPSNAATQQATGLEGIGAGEQRKTIHIEAKGTRFSQEEVADLIQQLTEAGVDNVTANFGAA